jgi:hypothetical protein
MGRMNRSSMALMSASRTAVAMRTTEETNTKRESAGASFSLMYMTVDTKAGVKRAHMPVKQRTTRRRLLGRD